MAGAAVVDSILLARGISVMPAPDGLAWDRLALIRDTAVTIQIKTTTRANAQGLYVWNVSCGYRGSPKGRRRYGHAAFSILACVVLPEHAALFRAPDPSRVVIRPSLVDELRRRPLISVGHALSGIGLDPLHAPADPRPDPDR
ncbi:hypothetical protein [Jannaschia formosa]|uniref:hypothetical protein n=1 Tax=Jannaschia formosa TaxID=2259592 RepID=UPI000E1BF6A4|nr:hypothetical protein [Jannaschia formosa]TFL16080.1 hypothetical protein DR046_21895 [Jannaschia formosa]